MVSLAFDIERCLANQRPDDDLHCANHGRNLLVTGFDGCVRCWHRRCNCHRVVASMDLPLVTELLNSESCADLRLQLTWCEDLRQTLLIGTTKKSTPLLAACSDDSML